MGLSKEHRRIQKAFSDHKAERETWAVLIGRFMMAFSDIEHITMLTVQYASADSIVKTASTMRLGTRIDLLTEILDSKEIISEATRKNFLESLKTARKLAETRNLIAHNSLILQFYKDELSHEYVPQGVIVSARNETKQVTLKALQKLVADAEACALRLNDHFSKVAGEVIRSRSPRSRKRQKNAP